MTSSGSVTPHPDIPDEWVHAFEHAYWTRDDPDSFDPVRMRDGIAAVRPLIEARVRQQIADTIEADRTEYVARFRAAIGDTAPLPAVADAHAGGLYVAARIARGDTQ